MELEASLEQAAEDLRRAIAAGVARACVAQASLHHALKETAIVREELLDAERKVEVETFFRCVNERLFAQEHENRRRKDQEIAMLSEELGEVRIYAAAMGRRLGAEEGLVREIEASQMEQSRDLEKLTGIVQQMKGEAVEAAADVAMLREMVEEGEADVVNLERRLDEAADESTSLVMDLNEATEHFVAREMKLSGDIAELELKAERMEVRRAL